jgi:hypothetical protein
MMIRVETAIKIKVILAFAIVYSIYSSSQAFDCRLEFESQAQYDTGENATGVNVGDFNGYGYSDLIIANRNTDDIIILQLKKCNNLLGIYFLFARTNPQSYFLHIFSRVGLLKPVIGYLA